MDHLFQLTLLSREASSNARFARQIDSTIGAHVAAWHNYFRSQVASGNVVNGRTGSNCPQGSNLNQMVYDGLLAADAQNYANQCPNNEQGSPVSSRPNQGENVMIYYTTTLNTEYALFGAIQRWWDDIAVNGVNRRMIFRQFLADKALPPVRFTQMAWALTYRVGCAVAVCQGRTVVVCRYSPRGNIVDESIYRLGSPCSGCTTSCVGGTLCYMS
ncbi:hypothetical protein Q1695_010438 [Nippostrongylus brasiliensis]|nr:hypothetical protein Q1695_010438 [Nippostrongylus brasiliensis]